MSARWAILRVRGRSMLPAFGEGDLVVVDRRRAAATGDAAVVLLPADRSGAPRPTALKRLARRESDDSWWIDSDNAAEGVTSFDVGPIPAGSVLAVVRWRLALPRPHRRGRTE